MTDPGIERRALTLFEQMLDVPEAERDAWVAAQSADQPELATRIAAMRAADRASMLHTGTALEELDEEPPARIGAYRIAERIGRGGMGSVYRGERDAGDFAHEVAIKIVKPGLLSETLVGRFRLERQTLAQLRHPNIAVLHDGGETDAGSPYIVMELVEGEPLLAWATSHELTIAQRARLFVTICDAVAFAHRNLIVHRDITPSNILVTADGTPKLIDFGIAKPAEDSAVVETSEPMSIGSLSLTPGYAAPERMQSGPVTTAADIYSLGKVMAALIPVRDKDLEAIVAKATAGAPGDRFATARGLANDVEAWCTGMPVEARDGGRLYILQRFVRRHWIGVSAGVATLALLAGALVYTLVANDQAQTARAEAEHRFQQTRAIAHTLLFDTFDQVSGLPGSTDARLGLARTGLSYLDALADQEESPRDVRIEVGLGYLRLAQVVGGGLAGQLGRYEDANALLARADGILSPLAHDDPSDGAARQALAALRIEQSAVNLYNNNDVGRARAQAQEARALLPSGAPPSLEIARLRADAVRAEGDTFLWSEDFAQARDLFASADRSIAALPQEMQRDLQIQSIRATTLRYLGEALHKLHQTAQAQEALDRAVMLNKAVLAAHPDDPALGRRTALSMRYRAIVHRANGRDELARQSIEEARTLAVRLRARDPSDVGLLQMFAVISEVYMQTLSDLGRSQDAYRVGDEVREAYRIMVERAGHATGQLRSMAMALRSEAEVRYNGGDYAGACRTWGQILGILGDLDRRGALTETDRHVALEQTQNWSRRACTPPRASLGRRIGEGR